MKTTKEIGSIGEAATEKFLSKKGFRVVANNYITNGSELDLVAYKRGVLVFVEVKTRSSDKFGTPKEAVVGSKIKKLRFAASGFWYEQKRYGLLPVWSRLKRDFVLKKIKHARLDIAEVFLKNGRVEKINLIEEVESYDWLLDKE